MEIGQFFNLFIDYPILFLGVVLVAFSIFVNGYSDSANSISTAVSTKAIRPRPAIVLCSILNLVGIVAMFFVSKATIDSVSNIVNFGDGNNMIAIYSLCAALVAVIFWGFFASSLGIPSSQSHCLIAGLVGAGLASITLSVSGVNLVLGWDSAIAFTFYGILIAIPGGALLGYLITKSIELICLKMHKAKTKTFFKYGQIVAMCGSSLAHGAQDGLKFFGVLILFFVYAGQEKGFEASAITSSNAMYILLAFSAIVLFVGTILSRYKIIKKIGMKIFKLDDYQGFATDIGSTFGILFSTFVGIPLSTGQIKTFSIVGAGMSKNVKHINWGIVKENLLSIVFSFPCCGLISYLLTLIIVAIFK